MTHSNQASSNHEAQQAEQDAKQDMRQDAMGQDSALTDVPPEFSVNNRDNSDQPAASDLSDDAADPTDAGYDETVANEPEGGLEEMDIDDLIDSNEEELEEITGLATSTPSPTARADEDRSALPESNIAGEAPTQNI
ncbi:hypothetical protein [Alkanindiges illinoisensis]|uniref:Uncharacterized protein n=1 Tax=Alkanindiges illinoisensis TaxID=197183 RepID=A0A4Y7XEF8_9GAMM|nr:hypothetical protein [Alkanindiges illinoisensis]TEU30177.1 hypothetical protein E2B99_03030 [Alkanindiges illinoisensis]